MSTFDKGFTLNYTCYNKHYLILKAHIYISVCKGSLPPQILWKTKTTNIWLNQKYLSNNFTSSRCAPLIKLSLFIGISCVKFFKRILKHFMKWILFNFLKIDTSRQDWAPNKKLAEQNIYFREYWFQNNIRCDSASALKLIEITLAPLINS